MIQDPDGLWQSTVGMIWQGGVGPGRAYNTTETSILHGFDNIVLFVSHWDHEESSSDWRSLFGLWHGAGNKGHGRRMGSEPQNGNGRIRSG
jgi:hypothetical protein